MSVTPFRWLQGCFHARSLVATCSRAFFRGSYGAAELVQCPHRDQTFYFDCDGLAKCIERDSTLPFEVKREWKASKERGHKLFNPNLGGGYAKFDERPLSTEIQKYCVQDVVHMPALRELYRAKLCDAWWRKIEAETLTRVALSQGMSFNGQGLHMAKAPARWKIFRPSWKERQARILLTIHRESAASSPVVHREATSAQSRPAAQLNQELFVTLEL